MGPFFFCFVFLSWHRVDSKLQMCEQKSYTLILKCEFERLRRLEAWHASNSLAKNMPKTHCVLIIKYIRVPFDNAPFTFRLPNNMCTLSEQQFHGRLGSV